MGGGGDIVYAKAEVGSAGPRSKGRLEWVGREIGAYTYIYHVREARNWSFVTKVTTGLLHHDETGKDLVDGALEWKLTHVLEKGAVFGILSFRVFFHDLLEAFEAGFDVSSERCISNISLIRLDDHKCPV